MRRTRRKWHWIRLSLLVICGLALFFILYKAARLGRALQVAYTNGVNFAELAKSGNLNPESFTLAQGFLQDSDQALDEAEQEMQFFQPLLSRLNWVPLYGPTLAALPPLLQVGHRLGDLAVQGLGVAKPLLLTDEATNAPPLTRLTTLLRTAKPQLAPLTQQTVQIQQMVDQIDTDHLLTALAEPVADLQAGIHLFAAALRLSDDLPTLLGADKAQSYLILVQNNHELRATGGFVTSLGTLTVQEGKVTNFAFTDSYAIGQATGPHPSAPGPMQRYMNIGVLMLRDVNWSPDLPTTAQIARSLYAQETGRVVDGVITVDLHAVELLVGALAPLQIPGNPEPLTGDNVVAQIKQMWINPLTEDTAVVTNNNVSDQGAAAKPDDWWKKRKDFIPQMASVAIGRLQGGAFHYPLVARALQDALDGRAIQIWSATPRIAAQLAALQWDGGLHPLPQRDFLALVDTNMGYNKVDAVIQRALTYEVTWPHGPEQPAEATVVVTYQHPLTLTNYDCDPRPHYGQVYDDMIARCYFDYVRLFVPGGSQLLGVEGVEPDSINSQRGEAGTQFFTGHFTLKPGEQKQVIFHYQLPAFVQQSGYQLVLQKQAGVSTIPVTINVAGSQRQTTLETGQLVWQPEH